MVTKPAITPAQAAELRRCKSDCAYFINTYVMILNATDETWRPFTIWPAQVDVLAQMQTQRRLIILKARQLGLSWLALAFVLWRMVFWPIATVGIFSRREEDAQELLDARLKGMYTWLPAWMKTGPVIEDNKTRWQLSNGSTAMSFATNGGRQYTFSLAMVDEADFQPDLPKLLTAVEPTVDAGGRMWLISSANKDLPESRFKAIYRVAKRAGSDTWQPIFLPWHARPSRSVQWYERQKAKCLAETGALDDIGGEYPASDVEALSARSLNKRIAPAWLEACYLEMMPLAYGGGPALPGLEIYVAPVPGRKYVIGADPAEGNRGSDDSALTVTDVLSGEECAVLTAKVEPPVFGDYIAQVSAYYNDAPAMVERNNHGHTVILWLRDNAPRVRRLRGHDGKPGWMSSSLGKAILYTGVADHFRTNAGLETPDAATKVLHSFASYQQLGSIEKATLLAPEGMPDDRADSYALAEAGRIAILNPPPDNDIPASSSKRPYR